MDLFILVGIVVLLAVGGFVRDLRKFRKNKKSSSNVES